MRSLFRRVVPKTLPTSRQEWEELIADSGQELREASIQVASEVGLTRLADEIASPRGHSVAIAHYVEEIENRSQGAGVRVLRLAKRRSDAET